MLKRGALVRILVSGNQTWLGESIARRLAAAHDVVALGTMPDGSVRTIAGDARDRDVATTATEGCDAVIQIADSAGIGATSVEALDLATRGSVSLITTGKSLSRFILLSSLRLFERYPTHYWINEQWSPRPTTDPVDPGQPAPVRFGAFPFSVSWEDAADAMRLALRAPEFPHPFEVFHILGDLPHDKYSNEKAKRLLHWQPRDALESHWTRPSH
ncbi:MAG TPA: NAD-dependent epimerase/dehydratase family protein [Chloroflexota bacterium]|nr:NAD-dependent epimerase/dehydratase family protein [Chloroflexota bacterium]